MTVGVALCTYNGERFIDEQLTSILDQVPRPDEIVIADDGSVDGTLARVADVVERYGTEALVLAGSVPLGVTANFERALSATTSDLVALSDQDDIWHPGRLSELIDRFDADGELLFLHTDADLIDEAGAPLGRTLFESLEVTSAEREAERSGRAFSALLRRNLATGATVLLRRSLLDDALPFPPSWVHDEWLAIIAAATGTVDVLAKPTIDYRQHGTNQIGVNEPTLRYKVRRVLERRGERNAVLASRFAVLADRLDSLGDRVPAPYRAEARAKAAFEKARAELPANRLQRLPRVLVLAASGRYGRFASRGRGDILRDLIQPA